MTYRTLFGQPVNDPLGLPDPDFAFYGSVSSDTRRPADLLSRFMDVYERLAGEELLEKWLARWREKADRILNDEVPAYWDGYEYDDTVLTGHWGPLESIMALLSDFAPVGYYFGSHAQDKANFGYWVDNYERLDTDLVDHDELDDTSYDWDRSYLHGLDALEEAA